MAQIKYFSKLDRNVAQDVTNFVRKYDVVQISVQFVTTPTQDNKGPHLLYEAYVTYPADWSGERVTGGLARSSGRREIHLQLIPISGSDAAVDGCNRVGNRCERGPGANLHVFELSKAEPVVIDICPSR